MMNLYLIRHTRVDMPPGICYGNSDVPVADTFPEELLTIKSKLQGIPFVKTYSSPLSRCAILANELSVNVIIDERIREYDFGEWEQMAWDDIYSLDEGSRWFNDYVNIPCPRGESFTMTVHRVRQFLDSLSDSDENILIVTHAGIIRVMLVLLENYSVSEAFDRKIGYGEVVNVLV
jgi:alpha-ribazole phosphatase